MYLTKWSYLDYNFSNLDHSLYYYIGRILFIALIVEFYGS